MSQTYSTAGRAMSEGRVYSTHHPPRRPTALAAVQPRQPERAAVQRCRFPLAPAPTAGGRTLPEGSAGFVLLEGSPGAAYRVEAEVSGLPALPDPAVQPALWLVHDLTVPDDLSPADLAALPRGTGGGGNQPGAIFTLDGEPPTFGPFGNTLSVVTSPGRFSPAGSGHHRLEARLDGQTCRSFHPLVFAGPAAIGDMNATLPSGTAAQILTELFMRPATVDPELPLATAYPQRLRRIAERHAGSTLALDGSAFTRASVTLEGIVRPIPLLMPTREALVMVSTGRETT